MADASRPEFDALAERVARIERTLAATVEVIGSELIGLRSHIDDRFGPIDDRLGAIESRLDGHDARFDGIEGKLDIRSRSARPSRQPAVARIGASGS